MTANWTVIQRNYTRIHIARVGGIVLVAHATHTRPPWQWAVVKRSRWLNANENPWKLDGVADAIGGAGSWQQARRFAEREVRGGTGK